MHILLSYLSTFIRKQVPSYCINSFQFPIQQNCLHLLCSRPSTNSFFIFEKHSAFSTVGTVQKLLRFLYSRYYLETFQDQTLFSNNFENKLKVRVEGFSEIFCSDFYLFYPLQFIPYLFLAISFSLIVSFPLLSLPLSHSISILYTFYLLSSYLPMYFILFILTMLIIIFTYFQKKDTA